MQLSLLDIYNQMGNFAKGIVYLLAIMSIWTLSVAIKKWWDLRQAQGETRKFAPEFSQFLEEDNLTEAVTLADKYKKSHVARVLGGALTEIRPLIQDGSVTVGDINSAERAIEREMLMTITDLKRGLGIMATVGATAPFVGLLGTTMGIVNSFAAMAANEFTIPIVVPRSPTNGAVAPTVAIMPKPRFRSVIVISISRSIARSAELMSPTVTEPS